MVQSTRKKLLTDMGTITGSSKYLTFFGFLNNFDIFLTSKISRSY